MTLETSALKANDSLYFLLARTVTSGLREEFSLFVSIIADFKQIFLFLRVIYHYMIEEVWYNTIKTAGKTAKG
jgi:hypothetical protein